MLFLKKNVYQNPRIFFLDTKYFSKIGSSPAITHSTHDIYETSSPNLNIKTAMGSINILTRFLAISANSLINEKMKKSFYLFFFLSVQNKAQVDKIALYRTTNSFRFFCKFLKKKIKLFIFGKKWKILIKGFGRRTGKTKSFLFFRLGHSFTVRKKIPKGLVLKLSKKKTRIRIFTTDVQKARALSNEIIKLKPTFAYKDVGIRFWGKKPKLKKRKVTYTY